MFELLSLDPEEIIDLYLKRNYGEIVRIMYELTIYKKNENGFDEVILPVFLKAVSERNDVFFGIINESRSMEIDKDLCKTLYKSLITNGDIKYIRHLFDNKLIGRTDLIFLGEAAKETVINNYKKCFNNILENPLKNIRLHKKINSDNISLNITELMITLDVKTVGFYSCEDLVASLLRTKYLST
jgi:hypothetical protein